MVLVPIQGQEKTYVPVQQSGREGEFALSLLFCSIQALNGLDDAHPHWGSQSTLLTLPIEMLISSGNTPRDTPRNNV